MSLPTRIKVNIRDTWSKDEGDVQKAITEVKSLIGHDVLIEPEWQLLWAEMEKNYSDPSRFIPDVARAVATWCRSLCEMADDESNEKWTEKMLDKLKEARILRVLFDVKDGKPATQWSERNQGFEICFPKSKPISQTTMFSGFHNTLRQAFEPPKTSALPDRSDRAAAAATNEDGFTEVDASDFDTASIITPATTERYVPRAPAADVLPSVNLLERPEDLTRKPPYHLILSQPQYGKVITIQCSHQPSLELMGEYFKKWMKRNHGLTHKPPAAEINMKESCFGLGLLYDRLEFELSNYEYTHGLSPPLMLAFIEGVLGYRMTYQDSSSWTFRRDVAFR